MSNRTPRLLAVMFDAMEPLIALALAREGRMPALAGLLERGAHAPTVGPPGFFVGGVWPSFFGSANPGRHGQYCWIQFDPVTYNEPRPALDLGGIEPFWQTLDRAGVRTLAFDVPRSLCVPLRHGVAVHDFATHDPLVRRPVTSPPELASDIERRFPQGSVEMCDRWPRATGDEVRAFLARLGERIDARERAVATIEREQGPFDAVLVGLSESHCAGHQLWHVRDPAHPRHDPGLFREVGDPLAAAYARLDEALGRRLASADEATRVFVLLSHGMGPHYDGCHLLDRLLERLPADFAGARPLTLRERFLRLRAWTRRPKRRGFKRLWRRWPSMRFRPAFAVTNNEAWAGVRVNLVGRESPGLVDPSRMEEALSRLEAFLASARNPATGTPAFTRIERTSAIASGPRAHELPDLVAEWSRAGPYEALEIPGLGRAEGRATGVRTGDHLAGGLAIVRGPGLPTRPLGRTVPVEDLAPTLCAWFGAAMDQPDGRPIPEWAPAGSRPRPPGPPARG